MRRRARWVAGISGFCCMIMLEGGLALAQEQNPCTGDAAKFCKDVKPGGGRVGRCLMEHINELSPECKNAMAQAITRGAGAGKASLASPGDEKSAAVPAEYQKTYSALKGILDELDRRLASQQSTENRPVIFAAELLPANCNRGKELLKPQVIDGVILYLDRLRELGVQGVTIPIAYPLYTSGFPGYEGYVTFYREVAREVQKRGMKLDVETGVIFSNTSFSEMSFSYRGLTFEKYKREKKQMVAAIIRDLEPDYLNLGAEPDTAAILTGMREYNDPGTFAGYVNFVLDGLDRGRTKVIAGIGSWGNLEHVRRLASGTSLDGIAMHVYPLIGKSLDNMFAAADIARRHNKAVILDEAWLYKSERYLGNDNAAWSELFRRDLYGFWAPLDRQFLAAMARFARTNNVEFFSPFWSNLFFAYLIYDDDTAKMSYRELSGMQNRASVPNIINGTFTSTGEFYRKLIRENP